MNGQKLGEENITTVCGEANTCFQVLFLNSIWGIKVEMSIMYMGKRSPAKICHAIKNILFHGSAARLFTASPGSIVRLRKTMVGINAAPARLSQKEAVLFVFSNSACVDTIKLISCC